MKTTDLETAKATGERAARVLVPDAKVLSADQITRARQLIAELSAVLDEIESKPSPTRPKRRRAAAVPMPERPASREAVDAVRRTLRRQGVIA